MYELLHASACTAFLPQLLNAQVATGKDRVILELADLTHGLAEPCLMDVKMGLRNYSDDDVKSADFHKPRADLLEKLLKVAPDAASDEEKVAGGIGKLRPLPLLRGGHSRYLSIFQSRTLPPYCASGSD